MRYDLPGYNRELLIRPHPSAHGLTKTDRKRFAPCLETLEQLTNACIAPFHVVDYLAKLAQSHNIPVLNEKDDLKNGNEGRFFIRERDANAFCFVHPGSDRWLPEHGVNIIVAHVDTPNLRVRAQPTWIEDAMDRRYNHPGPYLEVQPNGGLNAPDWVNRSGWISGRVYLRGNREHRVTIPARIPHTSIHLETDEEEASFNRVRVFTGAQSVPELYKQLGVRNEHDLGSAELYFYPHARFTRMGDNGDYLSTYGLDDRACVASTVHAFLQSNPQRPSFVFGLDCEEIGSTGLAGRVNGFFQNIIARYLTPKVGSRTLQSLPQLYARGTLGTIPGICADVAPAPGYNEAEHAHVMDLEQARFGFGPFLTSSWGLEGNSVSARHMRYMQDILDANMPRANTRRWQIVGSEFKSDEGMFYNIAHFGKYFTEEHVPMVAMGVPVSDLHRPGGEMLFVPDLLLTTKAYKAYLDNPLP